MTFHGIRSTISILYHQFSITNSKVYFCHFSTFVRPNPSLLDVDSFFSNEDRMELFTIDDDETDQKSAIFNGNDCNDPNMNIHPYL